MESTGSNSPQLTPENLRELEMARRDLRKIRRAVSAARFEGYTIAICGGLTILMGIASIGDIVAGAVLTVIGVIEIIGGGQLRRLDLRSTRVLTINQLFLAGIILVYALWSLHGEIVHPADLSGISPSDAQMLGGMDASIESLPHEMMLILYGSLVVAALLEGGMALYYHTRGKYLRNYLAETPPWIIEMQKAGMSI